MQLLLLYLPTDTALPVITSPIHFINNGTITVAEDSNVTLRCEAAGDGELKYRWRRVSRPVLPRTAHGANKQNLTLINIRIGNGGEYFCQVTINGSTQSSMKVQVIVRSESS